MPYELEYELEAELEAAIGHDLEWEDESEWEVPLSCIQDIPKRNPIKPKGLTAGRVLCPTRNTAFPILSRVVANAVRMLDNTIGELVRAREAACSGKPLGWPNLSDLTACWLKYRLGVCIDDITAWTRGSVRKKESDPTPVAEVIRRLVGPRNLLANNEITYRCVENDPQRCDAGTNAFTFPAPFGVCLRTPDRVISLCPPFWSAAHAAFREQTIIHEAVHLTHCARGAEERAQRTGIGSPRCLSAFVMATNAKKVNTAVGECGFTNRCGPVPKVCACCGKTKNGGALPGRPPARNRQPLPDWRPRR